MSTAKRARTESICTRCQGAVKPVGGSRVAYEGMIARFRALGYPQCPGCRDHVLTLAGCPCRAKLVPAALPLAA